MAVLPSVEDLQLVVAIADEGSLGQAARVLRIAQPFAKLNGIGQVLLKC